MAHSGYSASGTASVLGLAQQRVPSAPSFIKGWLPPAGWLCVRAGACCADTPHPDRVASAAQGAPHGEGFQCQGSAQGKHPQHIHFGIEAGLMSCNIFGSFLLCMQHILH